MSGLTGLSSVPPPAAGLAFAPATVPPVVVVVLVVVVVMVVTAFCALVSARSGVWMEVVMVQFPSIAVVV